MAVATPHEPHERELVAERSASQRQCAGCGKRDEPEALIRVVVGPQGMVAVDLAATHFGRGAHVHPNRDCVLKAFRGGFAKAFKTSIEGSLESFGQQVGAAADRRIEGLLAGARRGRHAIAGGDVVRAAIRSGHAFLVVVASDAASTAKLPEIQGAIGQGQAIAWGNKQRLGTLFSRDEVAVCAVLHEGVANAIGSTRRVALSVAGSRSEAWWSSEDR